MTTKREPSRTGRKKASVARPGAGTAGGRTGGKAKAANPGASAPGKPGKGAAAKAAEDFVRGVLVRGEAAKTGRRGKLPPGVTHEIVAEQQAGPPKLRRRRFSLA